MQQESALIRREKQAAIFFALAGFLVLVLSLRQAPVFLLQPDQLLLAAVFAAALILADGFPIHLGRGTKLSLTSIPIYLMAVLLPASLAVLAVGAGFLIAYFRARSERGYLIRDIALDAGRWMLTTYLGYQVIHFNIPWLSLHTSIIIQLAAGALTFLVADFAGFSLSNSFVLHEPFPAMLKSNLSRGLVIEVVQYSLGIIGALAAIEEIWSLPLLAIPILIAYFGFKNKAEVHLETLRIVEDMADIVDLRDIYTGGHSRRVSDLVYQILVQLNIFGQEASLIINAANVHDIGKIGISDAILRKPVGLTQEEMASMQTHPQKGAELVSRYKDYSRGAEMIMHHHERWDGNGYPTGLSAHEIPFGARVIAVADSFDAMITDRPYRKALSVEMAVQILLEGREKQWDLTIVDALVEIISNQGVKK